ncbi:hypothetical protein Tco_0727009 [Tanacetum coccineum]|uniref:Uncharacterized protein n=1 Tax=Tanacetum coccineum TaxID=301880 RepID=A0ABQ4YH78_9ASTR
MKLTLTKDKCILTNNQFTKLYLIKLLPQQMQGQDSKQDDKFNGDLRVRKSNTASSFKFRYSVNYNDMTANRIDVVELACEEYSQEVLGFSDMIATGNPTPGYDPIVSNFLVDSPSLCGIVISHFLKKLMLFLL